MHENFGLGELLRKVYRLVFARIIDHDNEIDIVLCQHLAMCLGQGRLGIICRHYDHHFLLLIHVASRPQNRGMEAASMNHFDRPDARPMAIRCRGEVYNFR